jgi:hypothetical protein
VLSAKKRSNLNGHSLEGREVEELLRGVASRVEVRQLEQRLEDMVERAEVSSKTDEARQHREQLLSAHTLLDVVAAVVVVVAVAAIMTLFVKR